MAKFNFIKISKNKKIRYLFNSSSNDIYVVFLHGFKYDLEGNKPATLYKFCKKNKIGFLALEYSGHGKSYGKFEDGTITSWTKDAKEIIKRKIPNKKLILVGSSMGGWIGLNLFKSFGKKIHAFVGIAPAPEFLEKLMWKKFSKKMRRDIKKNGVIKLRHGKYEYPITYQLIKDGRKNKIFNKSYLQSIKITMIHGKNDESVPIIYSKKILNLFRNAEKKLVIIKGGDHSLSKPKWLNIIKKEIKLMI